MGSTNWQSVIRFENSEQYSDKLQFHFIGKNSSHLSPIELCQQCRRLGRAHAPICCIPGCDVILQKSKIFISNYYNFKMMHPF
jgi:hypothetical protein